MSICKCKSSRELNHLDKDVSVRDVCFSGKFARCVVLSDRAYPHKSTNGVKSEKLSMEESSSDQYSGLIYLVPRKSRQVIEADGNWSQLMPIFKSRVFEWDFG